MILKSLFLQKFRSYKKANFKFSPRISVLIGPNTVGKTNLLEAIFLLSTGKSFRAEKETDMIAWECQDSSVRCQMAGSNDIKDLEIKLTVGEVHHVKTPIKRYFVNGVAKRAIDFTGNLKTVLFWPEDLELITDSPSMRRKYLDFVLIQIDREYRRSLLSYEKGLRQRNKLLEKIRDAGVNRSQLLFWDQLLIRTGNYITEKRQAYIESINLCRKPFADFNLYYDKSVISITRLDQYAREEIAAAATLVGPHRDDLHFFDGNRNLSKYGSRGEQRLAVLWLKLAELEYVEKITEEKPVLLLDDIFSELDHEHRREVVKIMEKQQTIITTTDIHFLPKDFMEKADMVKLGQVK